METETTILLENGLWLRIDDHGNKFYRNKNKVRHREDGPAIELASGEKRWYLNGHYHREDGPAFEGASGEKRWYLNDKELTEDQFLDWKFIKWCTTPVKYKSTTSETS